MLFTAAGIYRNCAFIPDAEYTTKNLTKFIEISKQYKGYQEGILEITVQETLASKPVEHLSKLLRLVGLTQKIYRRFADGDARINVYRIDQQRFDQITNFVKQRDRYRDNPWDFINSAYGFTPTVAKHDDEYIVENPFTLFDSKFLKLLYSD